MRVSRNVRWSAGLFVLVATLGCPESTSVWLEPASSRDHVTLRVGHKRGDLRGFHLLGLDVFRCDDWPHPWTKGAPIWGIIRETRRDAPTPPVSTVEYGVVPVGFEAHSAAPPLTPGCYDVRIDGTGLVRFDVDADGAVVERVRGK